MENGLSLGLPTPLIASGVIIHVQSAILYGLEFCILIDGAASALNRMQVGWAKAVLGCRYAAEGAWPIWLCECGWDRRLGTLMYERAIMLLARLQVLPSMQPARRLLEAALSSEQFTWASYLRDRIMANLFSDPIPMLREIFTEGEIHVASTSDFARKRLLDRYRLRWVSPVLRSHDQDALASTVPAHWPYLDYQPTFDRFPDELLEVDWGADTWTYYKIWSVVKAFGRWPFLVLGCGELPRTLPHCPCCGAADADVVHLLMACPATRSLYEDWSLAVGYVIKDGERLPWLQLRLELFSNRVAFLTPDAADGQHRIMFVGKAFSLAGACYSQRALERDIDAFLDSARRSVLLWEEG